MDFPPSPPPPPSPTFIPTLRLLNFEELSNPPFIPTPPIRQSRVNFQVKFLLDLLL